MMGMTRKTPELLKKALELPVEEHALPDNLDNAQPLPDAFIECMRGSLAGRGMPATLERDRDRK
jgi:hypothetical protein